MNTAYAEEIGAAAARTSSRPEILAAQVLVESSGRADAFRFEPAFYARYVRGNANAKAARFGPLAACSFGLLQIMLETACELGFSGQPHELFEPTTSLDLGARLMAQLLAWAGGDYTRALAAYNGGRGGNERPPFRSQAYANRVFAMRERLRSQGS
jgi:hypothetical protein